MRFTRQQIASMPANIRLQLELGGSEHLVTPGPASERLLAARRKAVAKEERRAAGKPEETFALHVQTYALPRPATQLHFALKDLGRQWRFDFAWPAYMLAVEVEGLVVRNLRDLKAQKDVKVVYGGHATITGIREDMEKYNAAARLGWYVLRFEQELIRTGAAIQETKRFLESRGWKP